MSLGRDRFQIILGDHTSITDEDQAVEAEALVQVADGPLHGLVVDLVAFPDMVSDRPTGNHHDSNNHLDVLRLAVAAIAVLGEVGRASALEVGTGEVVESTNSGLRLNRSRRR